MKKTKLLTEQLTQLFDDNYSSLNENELQNIINDIIINNKVNDFDAYMFIKIGEEIDTIKTSELIELYNNYCDDNCYYEDRFICINEYEINAALSNTAPYDILENFNKDDFSLDDDYFRNNNYGDLLSYNETEAVNEITENDDFIRWLHDEEKILTDLFDERDIIEQALEMLNA